MTKLIHATVDELGMVLSQATPKRPRLESIVVRASNSDQNGPSSSKKHCPQSWSAGVLLAKQKNNAADGQQSQRGHFLRGCHSKL
jgi:predicted alpha/beta hydrolase family esterase